MSPCGENPRETFLAHPSTIQPIIIHPFSPLYSNTPKVTSRIRSPLTRRFSYTVLSNFVSRVIICATTLEHTCSHWLLLSYLYGLRQSGDNIDVGCIRLVEIDISTLTRVHDILATTRSKTRPNSPLPRKLKVQEIIMEDSQRDFHHPYKPYSIQLDFMNAVYLTIEDGCVGIFESPTGMLSGNISALQC